MRKGVCGAPIIPQQQQRNYSCWDFTSQNGVCWLPVSIMVRYNVSIHWRKSHNILFRKISFRALRKLQKNMDFSCKIVLIFLIGFYWIPPQKSIWCQFTECTKSVKYQVSTCCRTKRKILFQIKYWSAQIYNWSPWDLAQSEAQFPFFTEKIRINIVDFLLPGI